ncbi:centrin, putative [Trichomonas vaginalis G3]|uniref:Centrin, putative n=1 Tax=Trichomonas vaginalis (strain ATCC PRA-98 / G3) TaxID=412133 RepID=A2DW12_TRIV3|nr:calcium ion binding [Trichomonas vaginalis G3]EAY15457.1 centrin, putative [Trichomonas vaginalis G3]KAI5499558.1 calcium ion binding [Trichomonas vaginalis G3]|eukprot:XP_001327680.1 centrin [Trichomonas vaginalis G3]
MNSLDKRVPRSLNDEQIREIKDAFDMFDVDGSGKIDPQELCVSLYTLGFDGVRDEVKKIIAELENIKGRYIDFPEFLKLVNATMQNRDPQDEMDKAFQRFDDDCTDRISFRNLKRVSLELGEQLTDEELQEMIRVADIDKDGEIGKDDFRQIMKTSDF